eukprot:GHVT01094662.1.p1 GENE.GHVT01094662.1~~GHVT01094662.1.p1  ORF type:complete len:763 (+),score=160.68 GHVT01094662.1:333-2621(+)
MFFTMRNSSWGPSRPSCLVRGRTACGLRLRLFPCSLAIALLCALLVGPVSSAPSDAVAGPATAGKSPRTALGHCRCPENFFQYKGECVQVMARSPVATCPYFPVSGHTDACLRQVSPLNACPEQFTYQPGLGCEKALLGKPWLSCPEGTLVDDFCHLTRSFPPLRRCATGTLNGSTCLTVVTKAPTAAPCPDGSILHEDFCVAAASGNSRPACAAGATLVDNMCERTLYTRKLYQCPDRGMAFQGLVDELPPSKQLLVKERRLCPYYVAAPCLQGEQQHQLQRKRRLGAKRVVKKTWPGPAPPSPRALAAKRSASKQKHHLSVGPTVLDKHPNRTASMICSAIEFTVGTGACPMGYVPLEQTSETHETGHVYTSTPSDCYKIEYSIPKIECDEFVVDEKQDPQCLALAKIPINLICEPENFLLIDGTCIAWEEIEAEKYCPDEYAFDGTHCAATVKVQPKKVCNQGFTLEDDTYCIKKLIEDPVVCEKHQLQVQTQCYETESPVTKCPQGFEPSARLQGKCVAFVTTPPECSSKAWAKHSSSLGLAQAASAVDELASQLSPSVDRAPQASQLVAHLDDDLSRWSLEEEEHGQSTGYQKYEMAFESHSLLPLDSAVVDLDESGELYPLEHAVAPELVDLDIDGSSSSGAGEGTGVDYLEPSVGNEFDDAEEQRDQLAQVAAGQQQQAEDEFGALEGQEQQVGQWSGNEINDEVDEFTQSAAAETEEFNNASQADDGLGVEAHEFQADFNGAEGVEYGSWVVTS